MFVSLHFKKYLAKGRDLEEAAVNLESAKDLRTDLKQHLSQYSERLEIFITCKINGKRYRNIKLSSLNLGWKRYANESKGVCGSITCSHWNLKRKMYN